MIRKLTSTQLAVDLTLGVLWFLLNAFPAGLDVGQLLVALGMGAAYALHRLSPPVSLAVAWAFCLGQVLAGVGALPSDLAVIPVLFATAAYGSPRLRWTGFGSAFAGAFVIALTILLPEAFPGVLLGRNPFVDVDAAGVHGSEIVFVAATAAFLLSWTAGLLFRTARQSRDSRRAAFTAQREVVAEQERTRIARDMHDVVAHSLAVVVAQADGARYLGAKDPDAVDAALQTIAATARDALSDVRVLLAQLRHNQVDGPQPTLVDLDRLLEQAGASGLVIEQEVTGAPLPLGTAQQLAVYRIVQESLTNALRHADTTQPVRLHFAWTPHGLELTVTSVSPPDAAGPRTNGHGVAGMTERALLVGGHLSAQPEGGRFVVRAWLPAHPELVGA